MAFYNSAILVSAVATSLQTAVNNIKAAWEGFVIVPPDMSPITAAFIRVTSAARETVPALGQAGTQGGAGFSSGLLNGCSMAPVSYTHLEGDEIPLSQYTVEEKVFDTIKI